MKKLLSNMALYTCLLIITAIWILHVVDDQFKQERKSKYGWVLNIKNKSFDFVFHGSSRVHNMLNAKLFEEKSKKPTINIGTAGSGLADNYLLLYLFLQQNNNRAKTLLLQIDPFSLSSKNSFSDPFHEYIYIPYLPDDEIEKVLLEHTSYPSYLRWKFLPQSAYLEFNTEYNVDRLFESTGSKLDRTNGYVPNNRSVFRADSLDYPLIKTPDAADIKYLQSIITLCKKTSTHLVLYSAPIFRYDKHFKNAEADSIIIELAMKNSVRYIDLKMDTAFNDPALFADITHLNRKGSDQFTLTMTGLLERPESLPP